MTEKHRLEVATPSDREVVMTRVFDAPRALVFEAWTKAELVQRWLWGPDEWPIAECTIDFRVGGRYRLVWRNTADGKLMGMGGVYREIVPPERLVNTELFDEDWTGGETLVTYTFTELAGRTTMTCAVLYSSREARDGALKTGMADGFGQALDRLAALVREMAPGDRRSVA